MVQDSLFTSPYGKEKDYWSWEVNTHKHSENRFENISSEKNNVTGFCKGWDTEEEEEVEFK